MWIEHGGGDVATGDDRVGNAERDVGMDVSAGDQEGDEGIEGQRDGGGGWEAVEAGW